MAIVKFGGGGGLERRVGIKAAKKAAKKGARQAIEKHAAKKHPAKKHAEKHAGKKAAKKTASNASQESSSKISETAANAAADLSHAFHSLQRASALISLLETGSGDDLRKLLELGTDLYRTAIQTGGKDIALCATGLLRSAEHLAMAGLYSARLDHRVKVDVPDADEVRKHLEKLRPRFEALDEPHREHAHRLYGMAQELLRRADEATGFDPHLVYEWTMAAEGLCTALEQGL